MRTSNSNNERTLTLLYQRRYWSWSDEFKTAAHEFGLTAAFEEIRVEESSGRLGYRVDLVYDPTADLPLNISAEIIPSVIHRLGRWFLQGDPGLAYIIAEQTHHRHWRATSGIRLEQAQRNLDRWLNSKTMARGQRS